jgi:carboxypeptidase C (cathepsin A)
MKKLLLFLVLLFSVASQAQDKTATDKNIVVTKHQMKLGNTIIKYTATTGYMLMKDENDSLLAKVFYIAYTKDGEDSAKRPLLFAYNGGPGSASVWLHMGAIGPKKVVLSDKGEMLQPPFSYTDNDQTWLDKTDIVFIDPMMTGFTRPAHGKSKSDFTGYENDTRFVGDFIRLYTTKNARWNSPKFIGGESYGTTRSAGVANYLQERYGMYLNGVILISAILDFGADETDRGNDRPYPLQLPTFAATAWYHHQLSPQYNDLHALLKEVEHFAMTDYAMALLKGDAITDAERNAIADKLHQYTGLPKDYILQANLRLQVGRFNKELLRDSGLTVGRLDSRFTGYDYDNAGESFEYDPSYDKTIYGPFAAAVNDYIKSELKFDSELPYEILTGRVGYWPLSNDRYLNVAESLREAMTKNPFLKVWIAQGYYDMATPYFATENVVAHMFLRKDIRKNLHFTFYEAGHMVYINKPSLARLKNDFSAFLQQALPQ